MLIRIKVLLVLLFVSLSVAFAQNVNVGKPQDFKVEKHEGKELIITLKIPIENVSSKGVGVIVKDGKIYKDGEYFGDFRLLDKIKLKKNSNEHQKLRIKVDLQKELNLSSGLELLMKKQIELKMTGKLKATWLIFWKKYPFEYQHNVSIKDFM